MLRISAHCRCLPKVLSGCFSLGDIIKRIRACPYFSGKSFATIASSYSSKTIAFIVGLISIFNGIGRTFFGAANDRIGRERTMLVITISFLISATILILAHLSVSYILMIIAFMATGFSYGGITPTNSAFVYSEYGNLYYSQNLSLVNLNLLFASFGGTLSGYFLITAVRFCDIPCDAISWNIKFSDCLFVE